jgi:hypothetical protein
MVFEVVPVNWLALISAVMSGVLFVVVAAEPDYQPSRWSYLAFIAVAFLSAGAKVVSS